MNPADPFYIGELLPSAVTFFIGFGIVVFTGWLIAPRRKK